MKEQMNIYHAITEILNNGKLSEEVRVIKDFNPTLLVQIKGSYNHNYYKYDNSAILLEVADDDNFLTYFVCDKEFNVIAQLGGKYSDYSNNICELEANIS